MLPRLMASRSLRAVNEIAAGTGSLPKDVQKDLIRLWEQQADSDHQRPRQINPRQAARIGIGYRRVVAKASA